MLQLDNCAWNKIVNKILLADRPYAETAQDRGMLECNFIIIAPFYCSQTVVSFLAMRSMRDCKAFHQSQFSPACPLKLIKPQNRYMCAIEKFRPESSDTLLIIVAAIQRRASLFNIQSV